MLNCLFSDILAYESQKCVCIFHQTYTCISNHGVPPPLSKQISNTYMVCSIKIVLLNINSLNGLRQGHQIGFDYLLSVKSAQIASGENWEGLSGVLRLLMLEGQLNVPKRHSFLKALF